MPSYTFQLENSATICVEAVDVVLSDGQSVRDFAVGFAATIFQLHPELCGGEWERCAVHALADNEEVFAATVPEAALMERDDLLQQRSLSADN